MNSEYFTPARLVLGFVLGLACGAICFGGLWWGLKLLVRAQNQSGGARTRSLLMGAAVLGAQLLVAFGLLLLIPALKWNPISMGAGVVICIFVAAYVSQRKA